MFTARAFIPSLARSGAAACLAALLWALTPPAWAEEDLPPPPFAPQPQAPAQPAAELTLILDSPDGMGLPRSFRTANDSISPDLADPPSLAGLKGLGISGSAQFSRAQLLEMRYHLPRFFTVVDLRQESHGLISGLAVSWYGPRDQANAGGSLDYVERDEDSRLRAALAAGRVALAEIISKDAQGGIARSESTTWEVTSAQTEAQLLALQGLGYFRLPITDHLRPGDQAVEDFLIFWRGLPSGSWLHFHCHAGKGRTTTFMLMTDILANAHQVELADLARRQHLLGGSDLLGSPPADWRREAYLERTAFLRSFYDFARQTPLGQPGSWLAWAESHRPDPARESHPGGP